jgi:hypothetical protein
VWQRGEVRDDVCVEVARELARQVLWHRFLITGDESTKALVCTSSTTFLLPYTAPRPADAG